MRFAWTNSDAGTAKIVEANSWDEAYEKVIQRRMRGGYGREDCEKWFEKSDELIEIVEDPKIISWFSDHHNTDLNIISSFIREAKKNNHKVLKHDIFDTPNGRSIVIWSGDPLATDDELREALAARI